MGDESAAPAVLAIAEQTPAELPTRVYLEVPSDADALSPELGAHVEVVWLPRTDAAALPGRLALQAVADARLPTGRPSVFIAGESGLATGLRRHLVGAGVAKHDITFYGYWRHGRGSLG